MQKRRVDGCLSTIGSHGHLIKSYVLYLIAVVMSLTGAEAQVVAPVQVKPWLGVAIEAGTSGVLVRDVVPETPAQVAGLRKGDEIVAINDVPVKQPDQLMTTIQSLGVGNQVRVHFVRDGKRETKNIKLEVRPDDLALLNQKLVNRPAPSFDLPVVVGSAGGSLAKLKGKVILIEFWATWCPACRATHPRLSALQKKHGDKLAVLGISNEPIQEQTSYAQDANIAFTLLADPQGKIQNDFFVNAIPQLVVIDRFGKIILATVGAGDYLEQAIGVVETFL